MRKVLAGTLCAALWAASLPQPAWAQAAAARAVPVRPVPAPAVPLFAPRLAPAAPLLPAALFAPAPAAAGLGAGAPNAAVPSPDAARPMAAAAAAVAAAAARRQGRPAAAAPGSPAPAAAPSVRSADVTGLVPANDDAAAAPASPAPPAPRRGFVARRFAELRAAFGTRRPEAVEAAGPSPAPGRPALRVLRGGEAARDAAPRVPAPSAAASAKRGFAAALVYLLVAIAAEQVGNETQGAALPQLIGKVFGDVAVSADLGIWSGLADFAGSMLAPFLIKRLGLKSAYLWSAGGRLLSGAAIAGFLAMGHMTVPALVAASVFGGFAWGVNYTAEKSIITVLLKQDREALERFKAARQMVIEVVATVVPIGVGALVASTGFLPALVAFPLAAAASMAIVAFLLDIPRKAEAVMRRALPKPGVARRGFWRSLTRGARVTWRTPGLWTAFWGYSLFYVTTPLLYYLVAPAYGLHVAGHGDEALATLLQGVLLGMFSFGGLLAGFFMMREHGRLAGLGEAERASAISASLIWWVRAGALSAAALAAMALPLSGLAAVVVPAAALIPFGVAQVVAKLKVDAFFQARAPADAIDDATAFMEGASMLVQMAVLWAAKAAFTAWTGTGPFLALALAMLPFAAACLWVGRLLAAHQKTV